MLSVQVLKRCLHLAHRGPWMAEKKSKTAKDIIKAVNSSSLIRKEEKEVDRSQQPSWKVQQLALRKKFKGEKWNPSKRLSREQMDGLRLVKSQFPALTASDLGQRFKVSPEVVRRILRAKWQPTEKEMTQIQERWARRGERVQQLNETEQRRGERVQQLNETDKDVQAAQSPQQEPLAITKRIIINSTRGAPVFTVHRNKSIKRQKNWKNKLYLLQQGNV